MAAEHLSRREGDMHASISGCSGFACVLRVHVAGNRAIGRSANSPFLHHGIVEADAPTPLGRNRQHSDEVVLAVNTLIHVRMEKMALSSANI